MTQHYTESIVWVNRSASRDRSFHCLARLVANLALDGLAGTAAP